MSKYEIHDQGDGIRTSGNTGAFSLHAAFAVLVGVAIAGIILWLFFGVSPRSRENIAVDEKNAAIEEISSGIDELSALSGARDYDSALVKVDDLLRRAREEGAPPFVEAHLQYQRALNLFRTNDVAKQIEAVQVAKNIAGDTRINNQTRATAINRILSFYYADRSPIIFEAIFNGEPLSSFLEEGKDRALLKVAEFGVDLFPTSLGVLRIAVWYSAELLDNKELSEETRLEYKSSIEESVKEAEALFEQESNRDSSAALYYHWLGYHLGVLAREDANNTEAFENAFKSALHLYSPGEAGDDVIATTLAFTHFYYAAFLHEVFGESRIEDQRTLLKTVTDMIYANPNLYSTGFLSFLEVERDRLPETRDHNYNWFVELAEISPEFKTLLEDSGWEL